MAIIWDDGFFVELDDNRTLSIEGRLSSGKTLLAIELAHRYLERGYKLVSQTACVWNDDPDTVVPGDRGKLRFVAIVDEGGLYVRSQKTASSLASFAAKVDSYVILSGRKPPHEDLRSLTCQLWFDFYKFFLIPLKLWRWEVNNGSKNYHGYFLQTGWWEYWGVYDTLDPGDNPTVLVGWLKRWTAQFFERYNRSYSVSDVETGGGEDQQEFSNELASSVRSFNDAAKALSQQQARRRR